MLVALATGLTITDNAGCGIAEMTELDPEVGEGTFAQMNTAGGLLVMELLLVLLHY